MNGEEGLKVNLHQLLRAMIEKGASNMHITAVVGRFSPAPAEINSAGPPPQNLGPRPQISELEAR